MTSLRLRGIAGIITIGLGTVMFLTNPDRQGYKYYAEETLETHLKEKICAQTSKQLGQWLQNQCHTLVDTARPHLAQIVNQKTKRYNFVLFSIYQTDLSIPAPLPDYHVETLGILGNFYTYQADEV